MTADVFIPRATAERLNGSYKPGERHATMMKIAVSLIGNGMAASAVFSQLRSQFPDADKTDKEINDVISWAQSRNPTPCHGAPSANAVAPSRPSRPIQAPPPPPKEAARIFVNGHAKGLVSPVAITEAGQTELLIRSLYSPTEYVNIVCKFTTVERKGATKANPVGGGKNMLRDDWLKYFSEKGVPGSEAGAWMRPNPVVASGSGRDGAITNADITAFRFLLLESDELSIEEQLAVYERLNLPLSAILTSGGQSCHAWLRLDAEDAEDYALKAGRIYAALARFGFDQANKNPSRLSRLAGAKRTIGGTGDGIQRLLYLAPEAKALTDEGIAALEIRVRPPKFSPRSMREGVFDALDHYEDIYHNKSKTGLKTGFPRFDSLTGGLKKGWLIVVAGETNSGKSSYVLNMILNVLNQGKHVALFSFEMDQQEIIDIFFAREGRINRNKFNNGYFSNSDLNRMQQVGPGVINLPLACFDDPMMTIADVMECCERQAADGELSLVVIDYLQLANCEGFKDNREQQVALVSRMSKAMAKKFKVPVIAVSQLNEDGKVRESRGIAHDANCIIKLVENDDGAIEAKVIKGRSIPKGSYYFRFEREECRFVETGCDENLTRLIPEERQDEIAI